VTCFRKALLLLLTTLAGFQLFRLGLSLRYLDAMAGNG